MKPEELAAVLNGREYGNEITKAEEKAAKDAGLVVLFGASDDLAEFRGAIYDEAGAYEGADLYILNGEVLGAADCDCRHARAAHSEAIRKAARIVAQWCEVKPYSWTYRTKVPHATFDVMEGDEKYCRGIVFSLADARTPEEQSEVERLREEVTAHKNMLAAVLSKDNLKRAEEHVAAIKKATPVSVLRCDCAGTPPTMPTCRGTHLPTCSIFGTRSAGSQE